MRIIIIADDLTGANDSAAQLRQCGLSAFVTIYPFKTALNSDCDVLVLDTESRDLPADKARAAVKQACDYIQSKIDGVIIFKKVDSTLRGHVGSELETLMRCLHIPAAVFAPAFPESGRTTVQGRQLLHGQPLEHTELAHIPKSPITTSYIPDILQCGTQLKTQVLPDDSTAETAGNPNADVLIVNARTPADLDRAAAYAGRLMPCVLAGSAGLARALTRSQLLGSLTAAPALKLPQVSRLLVLSGSISAVSQEQCRVLLERTHCPVFKLKPAGALTDPRTEAQRLAALIKQEAADAPCVLISGALTPEDVSACRACAQEKQIEFFTAGERCAQTMGALMQVLAYDFDGYVMTGGDTAVHACRAADADVLELTCELENGIAVCTIAAGPLKGRVLVSKAGAFGTAETFLHIYEALIPS